MKKIRILLLSSLAALTMLIAPLTVNVATTTAATCTSAKDCAAQGAGATTDCDKPNPPAECSSLQNSLKTVVNVLLFVLGAIAVIMIVVGGIRYTTSNGDASGIKSAKDTILYSVIGLIVALLAYAIVNFVLTSFT